MAHIWRNVTPLLKHSSYDQYTLTYAGLQHFIMVILNLQNQQDLFLLKNPSKHLEIHKSGRGQENKTVPQYINCQTYSWITPLPNPKKTFFWVWHNENFLQVSSIMEHCLFCCRVCSVYGESVLKELLCSFYNFTLCHSVRPILPSAYQEERRGYLILSKIFHSVS